MCAANVQSDNMLKWQITKNQQVKHPLGESDRKQPVLHKSQCAQAFAADIELLKMRDGMVFMEMNQKMVEKVILAGLEPAIFGSNALSIRPQSHVTDGCEVAGALLTFMERTRRTAARSRRMSLFDMLSSFCMFAFPWLGRHRK